MPSGLERDCIDGTHQHCYLISIQAFIGLLFIILGVVILNLGKTSAH